MRLSDEQAKAYKAFRESEEGKAKTAEIMAMLRSGALTPPAPKTKKGK